MPFKIMLHYLLFPGQSDGQLQHFRASQCCLSHTYVAQQNLTYEIIQVYISVVHYSNQDSTVITNVTTSGMSQVLKGIYKSQVIIQTMNDQQPITIPIIKCLQSVFGKHHNTYVLTVRLYWLIAAQFTTPSKGQQVHYSIT